jgi:hypothetical protein
MSTESSEGTSSGPQNIEFRVMPSGEGGRWYWEVIRGREVILRGVSDTEPAACQEASNEARKAKLIP